MIRLACITALAAAAAALVLTGTGALNASATATGPVIASGTLTDANGEPAGGTVRVYAWPHHKGRMVLPLLGETSVGPDGEFSVRANDTAQLVRLARQRDGYLSFTVVAETADRRGERTTTGFVGSAGADVRMVQTSAVSRRAAAARIVAADAPAPQVTITADLPRPPMAARAAQGRCENEREDITVSTSREATVVGELNNAYNDGTRGSFTYGRQNVADSWIGVVLDPGGQITASIEGEEHITDSGKTTFPPATRRYSRRLKTVFQYEYHKVRNNTCAVWDRYVRPTAWIGGHDIRTKQRGKLDKCIPEYFPAGFLSGGTFYRETRTATRWRRAASVFGFYTTARSGFSEHVTLRYEFGGPRGKKHYLCGPDGKESPYTAGSVLSGAIKR